MMLYNYKCSTENSLKKSLNEAKLFVLLKLQSFFVIVVEAFVKIYISKDNPIMVKDTTLHHLT